MSTLLKNGLFQAAPRRRLDMHPRDASAQRQKNVPEAGFHKASSACAPGTTAPGRHDAISTKQVTVNDKNCKYIRHIHWPAADGHFKAIIAVSA